MSDGSGARPLRTPFESMKHIVPTKFQAKLYFQLNLLDEALDAFEDLFDEINENDTSVFQESFRFLAAMYFFMGGQFFEQTLSERTGLLAVELRSCMNGNGAPGANEQKRVMKAAIKMIDHLRLLRQNGASLAEIIENNE